MSIKFIKDGPTYPTSAGDGQFTVYMGTGQFTVECGLFKSRHEISNLSFPMCSIMAYFENDEEIIVMRFDGTVSKYNKEKELVGFSKFDIGLINQHIITLPVGCVFSGVQGDRQAHSCYVRMLKDADICTFECVNDPEPIQFRPEDNPHFCDELVRGNRIFPALIRLDKNKYADERQAYVINSKPILITGQADI